MEQVIQRYHSLNSGAIFITNKAISGDDDRMNSASTAYIIHQDLYLVSQIRICLFIYPVVRHTELHLT